MKCTIPEISWHNRDPVLSVDIQPVLNTDYYRLASGGTDSHVLIWHLKILDTGATSVEAVADLTRHQRAVNAVRWSPSGQYLASGDDDANIIVWQQKADELAEMLDGESADKEKWTIFKILRGHKEDVYDISWSPNSLKLLSGSVDNSAIIWDLAKGNNDNILKDHKGFVQGVSWDPHGQYLATLSSDRICRIYNETGKQVKCRISKGILDLPESHPFHEQVIRFYHDDTLKSFFRRLSFSPDGNLLVTPAGCLDSGQSNKPLYTTYIYTANNFQTPAVILPSPGQYTVAVKFCPVLFELHPDGPEPVISLPYRMIFAVATKSSVVLYDTQQTTPFAVISNIHYTRLTDLTWSHNGRILAVSSTDGFCSLVTFDAKELGTEYVKEDSDEENIELKIENISICEEVTESTVEEIKVEEKKEEKKRPSFMQQWASKKPSEIKKDIENKKEINSEIIEIEDSPKKINDNTTPAKLIAVRRKPLENVNSPNSTAASPKAAIKPPETKNSIDTTVAKPIAVRRKPKDEETNSSSLKNTEVTVSKKLKEEITNSLTTKNTTPAKPIAIRKKPRDQMDITQFLKSPSEPPTKKLATEKNVTVEKSKDVKKQETKSKISLFKNDEKPPVTPQKNPVVISEDSVANDAWSLEKMDTDDENSSSHEAKIETVVIEDSNDTQNMRLFIEDTASEELNQTEEVKITKTSSVEEFEKFADEQNKKESPEKTKDNTVTIENKNINETTIKKSEITNDSKSETTETINDSKLESTNSETKCDVEDNKTETLNDIKNKINDLQIPPGSLQKKKVPFITLSSPKNKKKDSS